ncbi:hypothetical protein SUDANB176_07866 (plasmid) [Streptomyces sp. enrichment culture]|uniref:helicase associated domain-containing protein n=1 Tax=Streptomyces sp. enrichment culture TaxID=1795815 RepID=UPI003F55CDB9
MEPGVPAAERQTFPKLTYKAIADIGITAATARTVTASLTTATPGEIGLAHARSYAAEHGNLAVTDRTRHNGHPLGSWLLRQRQRAADGRIEPARITALNALDPHWNPPWPLAWNAPTTEPAPPPTTAP